MNSSKWPAAVLFDLLPALLDSWTIWNQAAGSVAKGRTWRSKYLELTYGCGAYLPYEYLVRQAAIQTSLPITAADNLEMLWDTLPIWSGAQEVLTYIQHHSKIAVVTNCSQLLGERAVQRLGVDWDVVVTAEAAGFYKPHPQPYLLALEQLGVPTSQAAFVAGSGYDLFGTSSVGLRTYWHNRAGLSLPTGAPAPEVESKNWEQLIPWLEKFQEKK